MEFHRQKEVITDNQCSLKDSESLLCVAHYYKPDIVDVAQDDALAAGTVDLLQKNGFNAFGPTKQASRIEWDKVWSRQFMDRYEIPHPMFYSFASEQAVEKYVRTLYITDTEKLVYVKAAGLCGGKGVLKSTNFQDAMRCVRQMKDFREAGRMFLVEEGLCGEEFSCYAVTDSKSYHIFISAQDNKRVDSFDRGDQTGGMGAISPAMITEVIANDVDELLISRAIRGMAEEKIPYKGILYLSGMMVDGKPVNIEYNARWGDPECQVVLSSVETDYLDIVMACLEGKLKDVNIREDDESRICVVGHRVDIRVSMKKEKGFTALKKQWIWMA